MRKPIIPFLLAALTCWGGACWLTSCDDTDSFTTDAGSLLSFSADTVDFGTVISTVGSSTQQLVVYNHNSDGLRITSVRLSQGSETPFRVNVDGSYLDPDGGAVAYGFEVLKGDSIRAFIEVTTPENGQDDPVQMEDALIFTLESGMQQQVMLTAVGQDAYMWYGKVIDADTLIEAGRPYLIYDSLSVAENATLNVGPGVQFYFHDGAYMWVYGRIVAEGTLDQPVVFRGDRTDNMFDYLPYDNTPSRWGGIRMMAQSMGNRLEHVDIHSGSYGLVCDSSSTDSVKLTLVNSVIHNVGGNGLLLYHCRTEVGNTQISNVLGDCVSMVGGWAEFTHCTLAQFYPWDASRGDALYITNKWLSDEYPLEHAHFMNCLMTGYADDVITGEIEDSEGNVDYFFGNCVLRTVESDDAVRFVNVTYEDTDDENSGKGQFQLFDTDNFLYDFRLNDLSAARDKGSATWAADYPEDRYGISRLADTAPDAGCYEYVAEE